MICINPMAPFGDRACDLSWLSTCITARIHCSGTLKRLDASVTKAAKGSTDKSLARCLADNARSACAEALSSIDDAKIARTHAIAPRDRKAAIVRTAVKVEALTRQPDGGPSDRCPRACSGSPLRATA